MNINIWIVLGIIFFHWIFDFVFQKHKDAVNKSTSIKHLINHTAFYSYYWMPVCMLYGLLNNLHPQCSFLLSLKFVGITFVLHTITDYFTSKLNSKLWKEGRTHDFFVSVGFDQVLHYLQLFGTYLLLT